MIGKISRDKNILLKRHDTYRSKGKPHEPVACPQCGCVFLNGRWEWSKLNDVMPTTVCPACRRIDDQFPAGEVAIESAFYGKHRVEMLNRIHNIEEEEKMRHPLERIMDIREEADQTLVATTGVHLARRIGEGISHSFSGKLKIHYSLNDDHVRVFCDQ